MKIPRNPYLSISAAATALALVTPAHALDYTWDGGTGNWNSANWNDGTNSAQTGPISAGNTATINSGNVTLNVGGPGNLDSITVGSGAQINMYNGDGGIFAYQGLSNLILQGGTVNGGSGTYNAYGASFLGNVTVSGTSASTITGASWFNVGNNTYTVADVTGDSATDLLVSTSLRGPVGSPDWTYTSASITKEGAGTMEFTVHSHFWGGLTLNGGTVKVSGGNGGYGFFAGAVNVNDGTTLEISSDGTGLGWQNGWKPASVNITGGTITTAGTCHIWGIAGGVNMTGGTLQSNGGVSDPNGGQLEWWQTSVNTSASADTATIAGRIRIRADGGYSGPIFNVADGDAVTDLLVSAAINEANGTVGVTKSGDGTMEISGANSYAGPTIVNGGTLVISGSSVGSSSFEINAGMLSVSNPIFDDGAAVVIANGATVNLDFTGDDTVGTLEINGSGPLPAGTYSATTGGYESFFTGTGSLVVAGENGTWISAVDGNWTDAGNWQSDVIAAGIDATASFNATADVTVTLPSGRIIGNLDFNAFNYVIAGPGSLILDTSVGTPAIAVVGGGNARISCNLDGLYGMEKIGDGTLVLSGVKSYTGGTIVSAGTLEINSSTADRSAISGSVFVGGGATLNITGDDYTGLGRLGAKVTNLDVEGGSVNNSIQCWVAGASVNLTGATLSGGTFQIISSGFNTFESSSPTTISSNLLLRKDYGSSDLSINVEDGAAANDLLITGNIGQVLTAGVVKSGVGTLVLEGTNTYTGNTEVFDGTLQVAAASGLRFRPGASGNTNMVFGSSTASLSFLGTVDLDLSAADVTNGNAWTLFDLASFTGPEPDFSPAAVTSTAGVFGKSGTTWTLVDGDNTWTFEETTGVLNLAVAAANDYEAWGASYGLIAGSEGGDLDNDGLSNLEEYAFGLIPNSGASVNPIAVPFDKATGTFSYTRRDPSLQNPALIYSVWYSTDLAGWTEDTGAVEGTPLLNGEVETVPVTISNSLLTNPKLFIQVRAD